MITTKTITDIAEIADAINATGFYALRTIDQDWDLCSHTCYVNITKSKILEIEDSESTWTIRCLGYSVVMWKEICNISVYHF